MPDTFDIHEAHLNLFALLARVESGEEIIIAKAGRPIAKIIPIQSERKPRQPGTAKGKLWIADDFDAPLPKGILDAFGNMSTKEACNDHT